MEAGLGQVGQRGEHTPVDDAVVDVGAAGVVDLDRSSARTRRSSWGRHLEHRPDPDPGLTSSPVGPIDVGPLQELPAIQDRRRIDLRGRFRPANGEDHVRLAALLHPAEDRPAVMRLPRSRPFCLSSASLPRRALGSRRSASCRRRARASSPSPWWRSRSCLLRATPVPSRVSDCRRCPSEPPGCRAPRPCRSSRSLRRPPRPRRLPGLRLISISVRRIRNASCLPPGSGRR